MMGRRVLILSPHPDDEVVGFAAQILRARSAGAELAVLHLTTGVPEISALWPWERRNHAKRVARRRSEAVAAADLLGLKIAGFLDIPTRRLKENLAQAKAAIEAISFDQLWVPAYEGGHQDHDVANFLGAGWRDRREVFESPLYNFAKGTINSQRFITPGEADWRISLSPEERRSKIQALGLYESEKNNLNYVECDSETGRILSVYDYHRPPHPGKCFYQRFQWVPFAHPRIDRTRPEEVCRFLNNPQ
jgi:LmbE family N-acetylglucosaminyl deacetylase